LTDFSEKNRLQLFEFEPLLHARTIRPEPPALEIFALANRRTRGFGIMTIIEGLLFDKDGTILDFYKTWVPINRAMALDAADGDIQLARELLRSGGHDPDTDKIAPGALLGASSVEAIADCFAGVLGNRSPRDLLPLIAQHFREGGAKYAVAIDGVADHLKMLRADGYRLGLATNDTFAGLHASLGRHDGLVDLFEFHVGCDSGYGSKPAPGMAIAFAAAIGLPPASCAIIGDTTHDLEMGRRAQFGMRIGVLTGPNFRADLEPYADHVIDSVGDLPALLARNRRAPPIE
jgi:phosphoglycolate phosphatase